MDCRQSQTWHERFRLPLAQLLIAPFLLAQSKRHKIVESLPNAPAVCGLVIPEIHSGPLPEQREMHQPFEIHDAVTPRACPRELERLPAVRFYLKSNSLLSGCQKGLFSQVSIPGKECIGDNLHVVES